MDKPYFGNTTLHPACQADTMPVTLSPLEIPPAAIARSLAISFAVGLLGILALQFDGWLMFSAVPLLFYALVGMLWYPWMELRMRQERIVFGTESIAWADGQATAYRDIQGISYRRCGAHARQLRLRTRHGDQVIALHHYHLPGSLGENGLLAMLADRVLGENPKAAIDFSAPEAASRRKATAPFTAGR
jgi:hypothetical protein